MKKKKLFFLVLIILALNLIWEFSHYRLYNDLTQIPLTAHLILASFTDIFWIFLVFLFVSLMNKSAKWMEKPKAEDYFLIIFFGTVVSFLVEKINLNFGRWTYKEIMPIIAGIGVSPLLQLFVTGIISLIILRRISTSKQRRYSFLGAFFQ